MKPGSEETLNRPRKFWVAARNGQEGMAVTFVSNRRSHELNLEYRDTDRPTDVINGV